MDTGWEGGSCLALKLTNNIVTNLFWKNEKNYLRQRDLLGLGCKAEKKKNRMVDLCSRHPHYRAVRVGNPIQALQSPQKVYRIRKEEKLQLQ